MKKAYPKYKEIDLPWLDRIPEGWEIIRYKYLFDEINERSSNGEEDLLSVSQYTGVTKRKDRLEDERDNLTNASSLEGYKIVRSDDLVTNIMLAWNGSLGISPFDGIVSPAYCVYRGNEQVFSKFFHYLLRTSFSKGDFKKVSSGVIESRLRMYTDDFFSLYTLLPPLPEQRQIAAFLDHKCALIDNFIEKKSRLIELLKEQKQAIINKAVTKGIDPNVRLKPSGIEWLGDIPEHWEVKKLKYFTKSIRGGGTPSMNELEYWGGEVFWVSPKDMKSDLISKSELRVTKKALAETNISLVPKASLLIVVRSGILQRKLPVSINSKPLTINQDLKAITPKQEIFTEYFFFLLKGLENEILTNCRKVVATVESIEMSYFSNFLICMPQLKEQIEILNFIKDKSKSIKDTIFRIEREINLIQEYKTTLIAEAVTGKIDVRDWEPRGQSSSVETSKVATL